MRFYHYFFQTARIFLVGSLLALVFQAAWWQLGCMALGVQFAFNTTDLIYKRFERKGTFGVSFATWAFAYWLTLALSFTTFTAANLWAWNLPHQSICLALGMVVAYWYFCENGLERAGKFFALAEKFGDREATKRLEAQKEQASHVARTAIQEIKGYVPNAFQSEEAKKADSLVADLIQFLQAFDKYLARATQSKGWVLRLMPENELAKLNPDWVGANGVKEQFKRFTSGHATYMQAAWGYLQHARNRRLELLGCIEAMEVECVQPQSEAECSEARHENLLLCRKLHGCFDGAVSDMIDFASYR